MKKRQYLLLVVLTVVAGLVGGVVSSRVFVARTAVAQDTKHENVITAEGLRLVDEDSQLFARLGMETELAYGSSLYDEANRQAEQFNSPTAGPLDPYIPTKLEWLEMELKITLARYEGPGFSVSVVADRSDPGKFVIWARYHPRTDREVLNGYIEMAKEQINYYAGRRGWDKWVKIEEDVKLSR